MNRWMLPLTVSAATAAAALAAVGAGAVAWRRASRRRVAHLRAASASPPARRRAPSELVDLPAPVRRYFDFALTPGQPLVRFARVEHAGEFRLSPEAAWKPFRSVQHFSAAPPGFVWDARIGLAPGVTVRVRDSYLEGRAAMLGMVAGLFPVVREEGSPELASGALHRYLAECAWLPTALLPGDGVAWEPVGEKGARVTLSDGGTVVALDVHFGPHGGIVRVEGQRYRDVAGRGVRTPFVGRFDEYASVAGMRIPLAGEVQWLLPAGPFSYWRGRIEEVEYRFDPR